MTKLGDALIIVGIVIILVTLYMGYDLYTSITPNQGVYINTGTTGSNSSMNSAFNNLMNNMSLTLSGETLLLIKIVILFLFGSLGYKFASLGISENKAHLVEEEQEEKEVTKKG